MTFFFSLTVLIYVKQEMLYLQTAKLAVTYLVIEIRPFVKIPLFRQQ